MSQPAFWLPEPVQPDGRVWRVLTVVEPESGNIDRVTPASKPRPRGLRRWWRRRASAPVIDLREEREARRTEPLPSDPDSVVVRLARLRDAGLITNAEFEAERRALRSDDDTT